MKKFSLVKTHDNTNEIDLTPMLDVVFIMLIFFIVTATFIKEPGVDVQRPAAQTADFVLNQNLLVAINRDDEIWIDKKNMERHQIAVAIEKLHAERPSGALVIQADRNATAEMVALVIDAAKKAGVAEVSLATGE